MPMVGGKKFPYTEKGKADAKKAADAPKASAEAAKGKSYRIYSTSQMEGLRSKAKASEGAKFSARESDALSDARRQGDADRQRYTGKLDASTKAKAILNRDRGLRQKNAAAKKEKEWDVKTDGPVRSKGFTPPAARGEGKRMMDMKKSALKKRLKSMGM
jgi:hypothetical protein